MRAVCRSKLEAGNRQMAISESAPTGWFRSLTSGILPSDNLSGESDK
jgi:hypothetical protein